ncbi:MAG TPA: DUF5916 domain-containing protein [Chitinophagaceae bacterium]
MRKTILVVLFIAVTYATFSQEKRVNVVAARAAGSIKIDGNINDEAWKTATRITGLVEQRPSFNKPEDNNNRSELYFMYDDNAVYFGGTLYEKSTDSISKELLGRDAIGVNDFIGIIFDTYQDRINGLGFYVTPLGEQFDVKYGIGNEDISWNTVYETQTKIHEQGWSFEMKIPYSAIRFSKEKIQNWGLQVIRRRSKTGQQYSWSPIDPAKFGFMNQAGDLIGITDIKPPVRLSFSPYFSTYLTHNPTAPGEKWTTSINGGMDVKYGISDAFTMDMTLIPDFGQVQSDNHVLNLTPFEVRYNEYRTFFNEGTELFNKGNLFYSRRIGGTPMHLDDVSSKIGAGDKILENPAETKLINATKISGRTKNKLGIGFFNAITKAQHATIEKPNGEQYQIETNPLTNYNVLVLDQAMKNNSSVSLVNTNVLRSGSDYDANVTALLWDIYDKNVDWNVWGQFTHSRIINDEKTTPGYHYRLNGGKFKGRFNFDVHQFFADKNYDQRDMGFFNNNNYFDNGTWIGYKWVKPKSFYNNLYLNLNINYSQMYKPRKYQWFQSNVNINGQLKNLWRVGVNADWRPESHDFYEPRIDGKMVRLPGSWMTGFWTNSNSAKKFYGSLEFYHRWAPKYKGHGTDLYASSNYRFSDKLSVGISSFTQYGNNNLGFAYIPDGTDSSIFGLRNQRTAENIFNAKYNFNNKMGLTFRLRHYWSKVKYNRFFLLKDDGRLEELSSVNYDPNTNVNFFNIDMNYTWQFAPGSFINVTWKSSSELFNQVVRDKYYNNLRNTVEEPQINNFSVKVIYFLDYLTLKSKKKSS